MDTLQCAKELLSNMFDGCSEVGRFPKSEFTRHSNLYSFWMMIMI